MYRIGLLLKQNRLSNVNYLNTTYNLLGVNVLTARKWYDNYNIIKRERKQ